MKPLWKRKVHFRMPSAEAAMPLIAHDVCDFGEPVDFTPLSKEDERRYEEQLADYDQAHIEAEGA